MTVSRSHQITTTEHYPDPPVFKTLDTSLKRNTAFVRKVKVISEEQRAALVKEAEQLNLSRYISEVTASLAEACSNQTRGLANTLVQLS